MIMNHYASKFKMIQKGHNTICGVFYRHPHGNLDNFLNHLNMIVDKIHHEKKYCVLLGEFNLDLLKFESLPSTENFLNTLGSYYFQPQILQPTRITDHSTTLIDNIFFNSLFFNAIIQTLISKPFIVTDIQSINWDVLLRDVYKPGSICLIVSIIKYLRLLIHTYHDQAIM